MSWITITTDHVKTRLAGAELTAYQTAALAAGQSDPLPEIIAIVTDMVRGYVLACAANNPGEAGTIPARLLDTALSLIRYKLTTRLPLKVTEARQKEYDDAIEQLKQVAACKFAVEDPDAAEPEKSVTFTKPVSTQRPSLFSRCDQDGI